MSLSGDKSKLWIYLSSDPSIDRRVQEVFYDNFITY